MFLMVKAEERPQAKEVTKIYSNTSLKYWKEHKIYTKRN